MDTLTAKVMGRKVAAAIDAHPSMTKSRVSELSGIPWATFSRKVNGHSEFTPSELLRIAAALDVAPSSLLPEQFTLTAAVA